MGPGNTTNLGEPVSPVDSVAKMHDIVYEQATSVADVKKADVKVIESFASQIPSREIVGATVGTVGLASKVALESVFGEVYPAKSSLERQKLFKSRLGGYGRRKRFHLY